MVSVEYFLPNMSMPSYMPNTLSKLVMAPSKLRPVLRKKSKGINVISHSAIWKVWVMSHHLSMSHCTKG